MNIKARIVPLVPHIDGKRRIWMFPRNIRAIQPWKMSQILNVLESLASMNRWSGNQKLQDQFCKALETAGLKKTDYQRDSHSGGPRTYISQLACLGLIFKRGDNVFRTLAGEEVFVGNQPLPVLQQMLIRHQYPSSYGNSANVAINPGVRVKPFVFVLQLLERLGTISTHELMVPIIYGHNHACVDFCEAKIRGLRANSKNIVDIIDNPELDLYLPRSLKTPLKKKLSNVKDIANTCANYLESCRLIERTMLKDSRGTSYALSEDGGNLLGEALGLIAKFIPLQSEESFQRQYGCYGRIKDNRSFVNSNPENHPLSLIRALFIVECERNHRVDQLTFIKKMTDAFGFDKRQVKEALAVITVDAKNVYQDYFLSLASGGVRTALEFEKEIVKLINGTLGIQTLHTGGRRRNSGKGGYADILILESERKCGIIDAKASSCYKVSSSDHRAMVKDYTSNYVEHPETGERNLGFCGYVAGGFHRNIKSDTHQITAESGIPCFAVSARKLMEVLEIEENEVAKLEFFKLLYG